MKEQASSNIRDYFSGKTVFITGATGLVGKLLLEKLLRSCNGLKRVYVLLREKKEINAEKRLDDLLNGIVFDNLRRKNPKFAQKVSLIKGDALLEDLGISDEDVQRLAEEVNCVFHCAADVRFIKNLKPHAYANVRSTRDLLKLSRQMQHLEAFIYVSTAYSNCLEEEIKEVIYKPPMSGEGLLILVDSFDDEILKDMSVNIAKDFPNTYVYSKCIAESVLEKEGGDLPITIIRPSNITSTYKEPLPGWANNVHGVIGVSVGVAFGLVRILRCIKDIQIDMIPADFLVNCIIAATWDTAAQRNSRTPDQNNNIKIYNYVCSPQNPITCKQITDYGCREYLKVPSTFSIWYPFLLFISCPLLYKIGLFWLHMVPAYVVDGLAYCIGKNPELVQHYKKLNTFLDALSYFTTHRKLFHNRNTQRLWNRLNSTDRNCFEFDISAINWEDYFSKVVTGGRIYLLKDPIETLPQGRRKMRMLQLAHYCLLGVLLLGFLVTVYYCTSYVASCFVK